MLTKVLGKCKIELYRSTLDVMFHGKSLLVIGIQGKLGRISKSTRKIRKSRNSLPISNSNLIEFSLHVQIRLVEFEFRCPRVDQFGRIIIRPNSISLIRLSNLVEFNQIGRIRPNSSFEFNFLNS